MNRIALAAAMLCLAATGARAQGPHACQGRVAVDTIHQVATGGGAFEYFLQLRNATAQRITVDVQFIGFPHNVSLFAPSLSLITIAPHAILPPLRFGRGTNAQVSLGTVARVHDAGGGHGPAVRLVNCRAG